MGPIDFDPRPLFWLALIGLATVVIGVPVGLFFLIRWLVTHLQWV